jgi:predicted RecB family nuclease
VTDVDDIPRLSPSALNRFLGCEYRTYLDLLEKRGELDAERRPPRLQLLLDQGQRHEEQILDGLRVEGRDVVEIPQDATVEERAARTLDAMRAGREVIYQACFDTGEWVGYPDFLFRSDEPSRDWDWSYEIHDAKLSSTARPSHVFQLLFYADALESIQGIRPRRMYLLLGSGEQPALDPEDFDAYAGGIRELFVKRYGELADGAEPAYPYPVAACEFCHWWHVCEAKRRADDHLSLVANLRRAQGLKLEGAGVATLAGLATLDEGVAVPRLSKETLDTLRAQADLQLRSRGLQRPLVELLEPGHDRGLGRLPAPSPGDVHFDFEGDQTWGDDGLEYLFGTVYEEDGELRYLPLWAHDRASEKQALEDWIDWLRERLERFPDLHVFHYNAYETTALKKLVARHATRELELDELLTRKVFVDLYGITRQAVRAGVEGYGLKAMEAVYGFARNEQLDGIGSLRRWQSYLDDHDPKWLDEIAVYNEDDCRSTHALYAWLWSLRPAAQEEFGLRLAELAPEPPRPPSDRALRLQQRTDALRPRLVGDLPDDESSDTPEQRARRLAFALTGYHGREAKPQWWAYFDRRTKSIEQLRDEDGDAIGDLRCVSVQDVGRSYEYTLEYEPQDHKLGPGGADDPIAERGANIVSLDDTNCRVVVRIGKNDAEPAPPRALAPGGPYKVDAQVDAVFRFAQRIASDGLDRGEAGLDLLLRRPPRFLPGTPPLEAGPVDIPRLADQVRALDRSALVVQGPPGTGKTYTGAHVALRLMDAGLKVGVMATSHKAINNFLRACDEAADETGLEFRGWRKPASGGDDDNYASARIQCARAPDETEGPVRLHAATAWWWADEDAAGSVDVLFVDEAGQVSLADAIAVAQGARSVVLLGDPQQLAHVSQGTHPIQAGDSVLQHVLDGAQTIPPDKGVFLDMSWRMHPDVCDFVSKTMYDGRLRAEPDCERQRVDSPGLSGTGLRMIGVEHSDNRGRSVEEAEEVARQVEQLLGGGTYTDRKGEQHVLELKDIMVVAPYNAQVRCLRAHLPEDAFVGTVDKFQGQEAPVVLFSMASSTGEDISRGMSFLFSRNRLNVAISRAQALAVVVCSPDLLTAQCSTVEDMRLVNLLCRVAEEAHRLSVDGARHA